MATTRARARLIGKSFVKFPKLPTELRVKIWNEAMPRHGLYRVEISFSYGPRSPSYKCVLRLEPSIPDERGPGFSRRIHVTRDLLMVCRESRAEVKRRFPDTVPCRRGELRFNAEKDIIFAPLSRGQLLRLGFLTGYLKPADFEFAGAWNTVVRKLAVESEVICSSSIAQSGPVVPFGNPGSGLIMDNFMTFLSMFALKQLALVAEGLITAERWGQMDESSRCVLREGLEKVYSSGKMGGPAIKSWALQEPDVQSLLTEGAHCLKTILRADPDTKGKACCPGCPRNRLTESEYAELSRLDVVGMVHLDRGLRAQGICREMEYE